MDGPTTPTTRPPLSRRRRRRRRRRLHGGLLLLVVGAALAAALASRGGVEAAAAAFLPLPVPAMPAAEAGTSTASSATTPGMAKRAVCSGNDDGRWRRPRPPASQPLGLLPALGRLAALAIPALGGLLGATSFLTPSTAATAASATRAVVTLDTLGSSGSSNSNAGAAAARGNGGIDYACLLGRCGRELGQALLDPRGMHELACLVTCGPSDLACQVRNLESMGGKEGVAFSSSCGLSSFSSQPSSPFSDLTDALWRHVPRGRPAAIPRLRDLQAPMRAATCGGHRRCHSGARSHPYIHTCVLQSSVPSMLVRSIHTLTHTYI